MSNNICVNGVVRKAIGVEWSRFNKVTILCVRTQDNILCVQYASIASIAGEKEAGMSLCNKTFPVQYEAPGTDKVVTADFVSRFDFIHAAIGSDRPEFAEFRNEVVRTMEQLLDHGIVCAPHVRDDPRMQLIAAVGTAMATAIEAERLAREAMERTASVERRQAAVEDEQDAIKQEQEEIKEQQKKQEDLLNHGKRTRIVFVWLQEHGIDVPVQKATNDWSPKKETATSVVGMEFRSIALEFGYDPDDYPKECIGIYPTRVWPLPVLDRVGPIWIKRNRTTKPERRSWFRRYYDVYIKSKQWKEFSLKCVQDAGGRCQICNGIGMLNTHHRTYENLGNETRVDVFVICVPCHELYTRNGRIKSYRDWIA
jgi:hypothetical protein